MACVYILTRDDGLRYVGITTNLKKRINEHSKNTRFSEFKLKSYDILFEGEYSECEEKEAYFINLYDTYNNGLNETPDGKGKSKTTKFKTLGKKYSEESRKRMSENNWLKNTPPELRPSRKGIKLTRTEKRIIDFERRKDKDLNPSCKIKIQTIKEIKEEFSKFEIKKEHALKYSKKSQIKKIENDEFNDFSECVGKNGKPLTRERIFSNEYAHVYGCSPTWIRKLLNVQI